MGIVCDALLASRGEGSGERTRFLKAGGRESDTDCSCFRRRRRQKKKTQHFSTAALSLLSFSFRSTKKKKKNPDPFKTPAIVLQYPHAVEAAAREWADRYQARRASAAAELMNLLVAAVGGELAVSAPDVEEGDIDALVTDLVTSATSHGLLEPFGGSKGRGRHHARDARAAYSRLWSLVVRELAARGLLGDNYVLEKVIKLLLGLTW